MKRERDSLPATPDCLSRTEIIETARELFGHYGWDNPKDLAMRERIQIMRDMALRTQSERTPIPAGRRRVVCAAVRSADGHLILGIRHYSQDMHQQIAEREDGHKFSHRNDDDQGFVDQYGEFMTREEAYKVAEAACQIIRPEACGEGKLHSEGIY